MGVNNINVEKLEKVAGEWKADPSKAKKVTRLEGAWNVEGDGPQFASTLKYEGGELKVEADQPTGLGGGGRAPGPLHYCLYGLASCYTATFATLAAMSGIRLRKLGVAAEAHLNFSKTFGLSDDPIMEQVVLTLTVDTDADRKQVAEMEEQAHERCPAMYVLGHTVPYHTELKLTDGR